MKMAVPLNLFLSGRQEKTGEARWWTLGESLRLFGLYPWRRSFPDKRQDFCYFLCGAFKIVPESASTVDFEKVPGLGLLGKSAGKQQRFCFLLAQFLAGGPVFHSGGR